ncbi:hypothetical protein [Streptomyces sp. SBT349]|uniref:hypothetical protein n=1 Tax=Streptomyces sp. SBT349 TaxID=1580539 RepID=UPI00066ED5E0|nr:hypothetical protein [Streptomyces sp. SBT349]
MSITIPADSVDTVPAPAFGSTEVPFQPRVERGYSCRTCGKTDRGHFIPAGWYLVQRSSGHGEKHFRLGLFCAVRCLIAGQRRLEEGQAAHAEYLGLEEEYAEHAALIERAIHLMHDSKLSIRQTGDLLGIATDDLRRWLRAGDICIDDDERLESPQIPGQRQAPLPIADFIARRTHSSPVSAVHELEQAGYLRDLTWHCTPTGPPHQPVFTSAVSTVLADTDEPAAAQSRRSTKSAAKTAAAQALLSQLADSSVSPKP